MKKRFHRFVCPGNRFGRLRRRAGLSSPGRAAQTSRCRKTFSDGNPDEPEPFGKSPSRPPMCRAANGGGCFNDSELNRLETLALTNNQNLAAAAARFEQARDLASPPRARNFIRNSRPVARPTATSRASAPAPTNLKMAEPPAQPYTYNTFTAPIYLGWELICGDACGGYRRPPMREFIASADDFESARLDVGAEVADDYFNLRTLDDEYTLIANTIEAYRRSLELTQNRRRGGIVSDLDVAQAATQLHSAEAQLPDIQLRRAQTLHALAVLCGQSPVDFFVATNSSDRSHSRPFRQVCRVNCWNIARTSPPRNAAWPPPMRTSASPRPHFSRPSASTASPVFNPLIPAPGLTGRAGFGRSGRPFNCRCSPAA
jgi:hypothetical protein